MSSSRRVVCAVNSRKNTGGNMAVIQTLVLLASVLIASAQRPSFAGIRPIGYPELVNRTKPSSGLEDKFGEGTTPRLPLEAQGNLELINQLSQLPLDKQPFWFINWQALEANRQKPETYPQRPNPFIDANLQNTNTVPQNFNPVNTGSFTGSGAQPSNFNQVPTVSQNPLNNVNGNSNVGNRFNTVASTATSSTGNHNTVTSNNRYNQKPVPSNTHIKTPVLSPGSALMNKSDVKDSQGSEVIPEENEFEDIQVKKTVKNH